MRSDLLVLFVLMFLATYPGRSLPLLALRRFELPRPVLDWLSLIPAGVLAALLAPSLFGPGWDVDSLLPAAAALAAALFTRSLVITVLAGILAKAFLG